VQPSTPESGVRRSGNALIWPGSGSYVYAIKGNDEQDFWRFDTQLAVWEVLESIPVTLRWNSIAWDGDEGIFATTESPGFYRYDIGEGHWTAKADYPGALFAEGACMVYDGQGSIIATEGGGSQIFWAYSILEDSWEEIGSLGSGCQVGSFLASDGTGVYTFFGNCDDQFWKLIADE